MRTKFLVISILTLIFSFLFNINNPEQADARTKTKNKVDDSLRKVVAPGLYSLQIPEYMTPDSSLNDEASLGYSDYNKELYIIVIDESGPEFVDVFTELGEYDTTKTRLENYALSQKESLLSVLDTIVTTTPFTTKKINGLNTMTFDVTGHVIDIEGHISYRARFIQGKTKLYFILTWTFEPSMPQYSRVMNVMLNSFKEM